MLNRWNVRWVSIAFAIYMLFQVRYTAQSLNDHLHPNRRAAEPFSIKSPEGTIDEVTKSAAAAGLANGDRLVDMDGEPIKGLAGLASLMHRKKPGESLQVAVLRNGAPIAVAVPLVSAAPVSTQEWVLIAVLNYVTPWFCAILGFTVAFLRPRDLLAWLLLLLMLSFAEVAQGSSFSYTVLTWDDWMREPAIFLHGLLNGSWALWMMLFGQYFPDRISTQLWNRVARWGLGVPLAFFTILAAVSGVAIIQDATAMAGLLTAVTKLGGLLLALMMCSIAIFFINISVKMGFTKSADDRRRLKLLYFGSTIALTPLFIIVILSLTPLKSWARSEWALFPALLALCVFPLTLAYVIVVERAMGVGVAVRQGLQYTLARGGVRVLMAIIIATIVIVGVNLLNQPGVNALRQGVIIGFMVIIAVRLRQFADKLRGFVDRRFFREAVDTERVLRELGDNVRQIVETQPLLETVTSTISKALHVPRVAVMMRHEGFFTPAYALGYATPELHMKFAATSAVAERLSKSHEPLRVSMTRPEAWVDKEVTELGPEILLPLSVKDRLLGFLSLGPKISEEPYTPTDMSLLESVASQTGLALENSRLTEAVASEVAQRERLNRELEIAREVQQRLFPQSGPQIAGLDYAGKCRPASSVGGDYYDFVEMGDGRLGIAIGDISGKGIPAALLMASLQASLRGLAIANPPELSRLMGNLNRLVYDASPSNRYATFFYGVYNAVSREFMYVNGGHNPPMIFRGSDVIRLEEGGPVVGLFGPASYAQGIVFLEPGDIMLLFTDGVSEAMNNQDEEFDEERLIASVRSGEGMNPSDLIDHVMVDCDAFAAGAPQHDDMTLVVVKVK